MKKVIVSLLFVFVLFFGAQANVAAATENDIIKTLVATNLPSNYVQQAKNYLRSNEVTAEEADQIIVHINNAQAILAELTATTAVLDITVTVTSKKVVFSDAEGTVVAAFPTKGNGVK